VPILEGTQLQQEELSATSFYNLGCVDRRG